MTERVGQVQDLDDEEESKKERSSSSKIQTLDQTIPHYPSPQTTPMRGVPEKELPNLQINTPQDLTKVYGSQSAKNN